MNDAISEVPMAAVLGTIFLGETLSPWQMVGAVLVILSVVLVSLGRQKETPINSEKMYVQHDG